MPEDSRFTFGLIADVTTVLESHGYHRPDDASGNRALGSAVATLARLCADYEGRDVTDNTADHYGEEPTA
ncbi:hypothetical protein [Streptomonospora wellingtoniae]|uniref:Uncharacterized protein n=1 Tax=Streptomonospora wellingtoniae TaxID=3075544 RepID=A0ABU2KXH4_9ACTN|nr:hypothetical protein [Streptomonospora sp. DSM 45055]MDT0303989.1 hypothetical protein [Streptomonospora sp. DSM 45055]